MKQGNASKLSVRTAKPADTRPTLKPKPPIPKPTPLNRSVFHHPVRRIYVSAYATLVEQARNKLLAELTKIRKRWARNLAYEVRLPL